MYVHTREFVVLLVQIWTRPQICIHYKRDEEATNTKKTKNLDEEEE